VTDDRERLAGTFDRAAELYDEMRPHYPEALFDDLARLAGMPPGGRVLEIGPGTGQATLPLARRGYDVMCIEPGHNLAAVLRRNMAGYPRVAVLECRFEAWKLEPDAFDLVVAATSFAWVDPDVRYVKAAAALRPGGCVAHFWHAHVYLPGQDQFWDDVQESYRRHAPHMVGWPTLVDELPRGVDPAFLEGGLFEEVAVRHYPGTERYDTAGYLKLLQTFSNHIALPDPARHALMADIADLIERDYAGRVEKHVMTVLQVARSRAG
jgi:SAM-dependent methyltransferase